MADQGTIPPQDRRNDEGEPEPWVQPVSAAGNAPDPGASDGATRANADDLGSESPPDLVEPSGPVPQQQATSPVPPHYRPVGTSTGGSEAVGAAPRGGAPEAERARYAPDEETTAAPTVSDPADDSPPSGESRAGQESRTVRNAPEGRDDASGTQTAKPQVVYISEPTRPKRKGNRGFGSLFALLAALVFAVLYAVVALIVIAVNTPAADVGDSYLRFIATPSFWLPIAAFTVAYLLFVLISNRAGWWAHVLGGFLIGVATYLAFVGGALLTAQAWMWEPSMADRLTRSLWLNPLAISAGVLAREVPVWLGAAVAARGRRVKERNAQAMRDYEQERAERRAEYERITGTAR